MEDTVVIEAIRQATTREGLFNVADVLGDGPKKQDRFDILARLIEEDRLRLLPDVGKGWAVMVVPIPLLPFLTWEVADAGAAIARTTVHTKGMSDKLLTELGRLCEIHGPDAVIAAFHAQAAGGYQSWAQLIFGARNTLEPLPSAFPDRKKAGTPSKVGWAFATK